MSRGADSPTQCVRPAMRLAKFLPVLFVTLSCISSVHGADLPDPLAVGAKKVAAKLPAGAIVTGERIGEKVEFAAAGNLEPKEVPPEKVIFEIGSITKVFTSLLLAQAVTEQKAKLETKISEVLGPEMKYEDARVGAITLKQLATHTSGLPRLPANLAEGSDPNDPYASYDEKRLEAGLAGARLEGSAPFPSSYSNFGAGVLGYLLARIYGEPWEQLIHDKITGPLGMVDTVVTLSPEQTARFAPPYSGSRPAHTWALNALAGAGALRSTAADLMKFGEALLEPSKTKLAPAYALLVRPDTADGKIGLGIMLSVIDGQPVLEHDGGTGGYRSSLQVVPGIRTVRVVLMNNSQADASGVIAAARREPPRPKESDRKLSPDEIAEYLGIYDLGPAKLTVLEHTGMLQVRLSGQPFFAVYPEEAPDRFFYKVVPAELQFHREGGKPVTLSLFQNGRELVARKTADPVPELVFPTAAELAPYVGTYQLTPAAEFTLSVQSDTLYAQLTGQPANPVFATKPDYFVYDVVAAALEFERKADGKIKGLKLHQNGAIVPAPKTK